MKRALCTLLIAASAAAALAEAEVAKLRLRPRATVYSGSVTLADVLSFETATALSQQVGAQAVKTGPMPKDRLVITHDDVRKRLDELGVNLSRVLLSGAMRCEVRFQAVVEAPKARDDEPLDEPRVPAVDGARTLASLLEAQANTEMKELEGTAQVDFDRSSEELLQLTSPPYDFRIGSSSGSERLGLREFRVVIRQDGRVQRTVNVFAHVRLVRPVVVAKRALGVGTFVRAEDVEVQTRVFETPSRAALGVVEQAIGLQVKRFVGAGELVGTDAVKEVDLVQRSRPVTVLGARSGVQVRLSGVAMDSGGYGQTVRVRLGDTRASRQELRGVVTAMGTVRLAEDAP